MILIFEDLADAAQIVTAWRGVFSHLKGALMFDAKSLFKNIGNDALKVAPGAVGIAFGPAAGALATFASNAILQAEANHAAAAKVDPVAANVAKKNDVVSEIEQNLPAILALLPKTNQPVDPAKVSDGIGQLVDSFVAILKGTGHLGSTSLPTAPPNPIALPVPVASLTDAKITDRGEDGSLTLNLTVHVGA